MPVVPFKVSVGNPQGFQCLKGHGKLHSRRQKLVFSVFHVLIDVVLIFLFYFHQCSQIPIIIRMSHTDLLSNDTPGGSEVGVWNSKKKKGASEYI